MGDRDYYEILGVERKAAADEIKRAYRKLAKQFHPDMNPHPDAARRFSEIDLAHDTLIDPDLRRSYDLQTSARGRSTRRQAGPASEPARPQRPEAPRGIPPGELARNQTPKPRKTRREAWRRRCTSWGIDTQRKVLIAGIIVIIAAALLIAVLITVYVMIPRQIKQDIAVYGGMFLLITAAAIFRIFIRGR